jgi:hypothetical protein
LTVASELGADAAAVWAHAASLDGVNAELAPLRMSGPRGVALDDKMVPLGRPAFVSVVTLWGVVPLDLHELTLVDVAPGRSFHEASRSLVQRRWVHVRRVEASAGGGCRVSDEVTFTPRLLGGLVRAIIVRTFARRHRRLRRMFDGREPGGPRVAVAAIG